MLNKTIALMGIKHCGKSTQGKILAKKMGSDFYDTDEVIAEQTGKSPRQIYTE
ncbi:MAG: shikimate kinase, partial [Treponema sp.]|nr:shikimate kinase [Treponema sp.]